MKGEPLKHFIVKSTKLTIIRYANDQTAFFNDYAQAYIRMSKLAASQPNGPETDVNIPVHDNLGGEGRHGVINFEIKKPHPPPKDDKKYEEQKYEEKKYEHKKHEEKNYGDKKYEENKYEVKKQGY